MRKLLSITLLTYAILFFSACGNNERYEVYELTTAPQEIETAPELTIDDTTDGEPAIINRWDAWVGNIPQDETASMAWRQVSTLMRTELYVTGWFNDHDIEQLLHPTNILLYAAYEMGISADTIQRVTTCRPAGKHTTKTHAPPQGLAMTLTILA